MSLRRPVFVFMLLSAAITARCADRQIAGRQAPAPAASLTACPRFPTGAELPNPPDLYTRNGLLKLALTYQTRIDENGRRLFCFTDSQGHQSPTIHVRPGDHVSLAVTNMLPESLGPMQMKMAPMHKDKSPDYNGCGMTDMTSSSVNMHFHGTNLPPTCHQDEVIKTLINSGQSFTYELDFPADEPPGLYYYHPHVHGQAESAVQGGASGAVVVEGLENVNAAVSGLPQRVIVIRDTPTLAAPEPNEPNEPTYDLSLNYVPVNYPAYKPVIVPMAAHGKELWRVVNSSADALLDLKVVYDGKPQVVEIVGLDGVPTGSQDGTGRGKSIYATHIPLTVAGRAEFIVRAPDKAVKSAQIFTQSVDTGPDGDDDPTRPLASIQLRKSSAAALPTMPQSTGYQPLAMRFQNLPEPPSVTQRKLYFSELLSDPNDPMSPTNFYITEEGKTPTLFDPSNPPAIVTRQGAVEDWIVENRTLEVHSFHIHQIHFKILEQNGVPVEHGQYYDTVQVPYWTGTGPYPSVKLRMDFRGPVVGDFVYHCHILGHEDNGMMAIIRVKPREDE